jgi:hypothetical protein
LDHASKASESIVAIPPGPWLRRVKAKLPDVANQILPHVAKQSNVVAIRGVVANSDVLLVRWAELLVAGDTGPRKIEAVTTVVPSVGVPKALPSLRIPPQQYVVQLADTSRGRDSSTVRSSMTAVDRCSAVLLAEFHIPRHDFSQRLLAACTPSLCGRRTVIRRLRKTSGTPNKTSEPPPLPWVLRDRLATSFFVSFARST